MVEPILITGCARSGTSMTGGIVSLCGAYGGERLAGPTGSNKKGMFENRRVVDQMVKPLFLQVGADPMGQNPLPDVDIFKTFEGLKWKRRVLNIVDPKEKKWFYKGAKMCLMWPLWHSAFSEAKWVIVRRKDEDIVNSCLRTGFMRAFKDAFGWQWWVEEHKRRFQEMKDAGLNIVEIWPQKMIKGDFLEIMMVVKWLGLKWKEKEVIEFISPCLWNKGEI